MENSAAHIRRKLKQFGAEDVLSLETWRAFCGAWDASSKTIVEFVTEESEGEGEIPTATAMPTRTSSSGGAGAAAENGEE